MPESPKWPQEIETANTFGQRLAAARTAKGYSQSKLARMAKCTPGMVNQIESGLIGDLKSALAFRISDALEVSARWLIWGSGPVHKWEPLTIEEKELLGAYRELPGPLREHARQIMISLRGATQPVATRAFPYPPVPPVKHKR